MRRSAAATANPLTAARAGAGASAAAAGARRPTPLRTARAPDPANPTTQVGRALQAIGVFPRRAGSGSPPGAMPRALPLRPFGACLGGTLLRSADGLGERCLEPRRGGMGEPGASPRAGSRTEVRVSRTCVSSNPSGSTPKTHFPFVPGQARAGIRLARRPPQAFVSPPTGTGRDRPGACWTGRRAIGS